MNLMKVDQPRATRPAGVVTAPRVLLVHPDLAGRQYTSRILGNLGGEVTTCTSFEEGIRLLEDGDWEFIVVSQGGAAFEGRSVLERIIEIDRRLPVLILTRWYETSCYLEAMQLGAVDYLEEPASPTELARVLRTHSRSRLNPTNGNKRRALG